MVNSMTTGIFIGRFQPFHNGHLAIIKQALSEVDKLIIVIGSQQEARTENNPLTADERELLIRETLKSLKMERFKIVKLADIPDDNKYAEYVRENTGDFSVVYCGENQLVKKLFQEAGYKVVSSERLNGWMATEIRKKIRNDENYDELVPEIVKELMKKMNLDKIINKT